MLSLLCLASCSTEKIADHTDARPEIQVIAGETMGTTYMVKYVAAPTSLPAISSKIEDELEAVNAEMSTYIPSSELSVFNQSSSLDWISVSKNLALVVQVANETSLRSEGAFDVTVGPLVNLWGFGPNGGVTEAPSDSEIQSTKTAVGFKMLQSRLSPPALRKSVPAIAVDLSAIAKGHGVDRVCEILLDAGHDCFFVEVGGEVRASGLKPDNSAWVVGIEAPMKNEQEILLPLELDNVAIATSGDYRNYRELDGTTFSHTINPDTGYPVEDPIASASAFAMTCCEADAIATAMMSSGFSRGLEIADRNDWAVLLIAQVESTLSAKASAKFHERYPTIDLSQIALEISATSIPALDE